MSAFTTLGTSRLGVEPNCEACGAGATVWFNWAFAHEGGSSEYADRRAAFTQWKLLRRGALYRCNLCDEVWHLDGADQMMTHVGAARLPLVLEWDRQPITLATSIETRLDQIGPTPPDVYGNGRERRVTPCKITTTAGEEIDPAMVCVQLDAPVQDYGKTRLGSEIASVSDSAFALPLDVRLASSRAHEMRMGFSPSLIEMPDGKRFVLNGMTSFMAEPGYDATAARVVEGNYFGESPPPSFPNAPHITYFVVDGEPGWIDQRLTGFWPAWFRGLFKTLGAAIRRRLRTEARS